MSEQPEPDDLQMALQAMGDLLAAVPYRLGYRLEGSQQLVVQLSAPDRRRLVVLEWLSDRSVAEACREAARTINALASGSDTEAILILGYGPEAAERLYALREAVHESNARFSLAAVQVDQGQWRAFGVNVTGDWHRMPEVPVAVLIEGYPAPVASLEEHRRLYDPLPEPTYGELPETSQELIDASPPDIQAELATRALHRLAERTPHPLDLPALARVLAVPAVNHHVVANTFQDRAITGALIDAYRGAPSEQRPGLAAAAAPALWLRGQIQEARQVVTHLPDTGHFATTGPHLTALIEHGVAQGSLPRASARPRMHTCGTPKRYGVPSAPELQHPPPVRQLLLSHRTPRGSTARNPSSALAGRRPADLLPGFPQSGYQVPPSTDAPGVSPIKARARAR